MVSASIPPSASEINPNRQRVLIVGCGGLGGIVAGSLIERDDPSLEVVPFTTNAAIAQAVQRNGFQLKGGDGDRVVRGPIATSLPDTTRPFDWVILATQPPQVEDAARSVAQFLSPSGAMVCLQNGLCEERVANIVGRERVVGAVVAWGASMVEPGVYERTSAGGFTIGTLDGNDERLLKLALVLESVGPVALTANLRGARWSKLAINCAVSTLGTLAGERFGPLVVHRHIRRLALELMTEVVQVAKAENVRLEKVAGTLDLEWVALTQEERRAVIGSPALFAKHSMLLAVGTRFRRMRSSMLSAIERGKTPAVDFLNGEVVERGAKHGIDTPVNRECTRLVHALARKEFKPGMNVTRDLAQRFVGA